jgi:hypothetical protein
MFNMLNVFNVFNMFNMLNVFNVFNMFNMLNVFNVFNGTLTHPSVAFFLFATGCLPRSLPKKPSRCCWMSITM